MLKQFFLSEKIILSAILLNAALLFLMSFPEWKYNINLQLIDNLFILFFIVEMLVKLSTWGTQKYFSDNWNRFDFFLVMVSIPALAALFMPMPDVSILLLFRILRLIRLAKFMWFIPNMKHILVGLGRAFKASIFVLMVLAFLNILLSVISCQLFGSWAAAFENPISSSYTIFQLFTIEGWNEVAEKVVGGLTDSTAIGFTRLYFVIVVLFGGVFGLSLANAIFVDEMTIDNNKALEDKIDVLQEKIDALQQLIEQRG